MKIHLLKENEQNPRFIRDVKFDKLVKSILLFPEMLNIRPIVIDENNIILGGNMRFKAIKHILQLNIQAEINKSEIDQNRKYYLIDFWSTYNELKEVEVIQANELTPEQKNEFIIKDNVGFGEWDMDILANEWDDVLLQEWGVDLPNNDINFDDIGSNEDRNADKKNKEVCCPKCLHKFEV